MEGLARELVSKVQQMRKQKDFEMMDHIAISVNADDDVKAAVEAHMAYITSETLADELNFVDAELEKYDLNGHKTGIDVEKK